MEDIFYFTKAVIDLGHLEKIAHDFGYQPEHMRYPYEHKSRIYENHWLSVEYADQQYWEWREMHEEEGDFDGFPPEKRQELANLGFSSAFSITLHLVSLPKLASFLEK